MIRCLFLFFLLVFNESLAQKIDSLKRVIQQSAKDTTIIRKYKFLLSELEDAELYKEGRRVNNEFLKISKQLNSPLGLAYYNLFEGSFWADEMEYQKALPFHYRALDIFDSLGMLKQVAIEYRHLASCYSDMANYKKAVELIFKEIKIEQKLNEKKLLSGAYLNIGNAFRVLEDYNHAEEYYLKSFQIKNEIHDSIGIANCYNNLGLIYRKQKDYTKAIAVYFKSLKIYRNIDNKKGVVRSLTNIGVAYKYLQNYNNALYYFKEAHRLALKGNMDSYLASLNNNIANVYILLGQPKVAIPILDSALKQAKQDKSIEDLYTTHEYLSKAYGETKNYEKAYQNHVEFKRLHDSIYNEENSKTISDLRTQFEVEKKELEVKATADAEKQKLIELSEIERNKSIFVIVAVAILLVITIVFLWVLYKRFQITTKQKHLIEKQKEFLDEKQKEIIDSINYSKRLQSAILPSLQTIKQYLPNSFIMYKPKDIVAGDFYWFHKVFNHTYEYVYIAAADSTGHGVPGAMVSVVCSNALNRAVKEFNLIDTGEILDKTRELVLETFAVSGEEIKDGMDISLCRIDLKSANSLYNIQWSGANNPIWFVHLKNNTNVSVQEIKGDKQPIGYIETPKPFKSNNITLTKGDVVYLFTDGYADQFGGDNGKKFKYKQLNQTILQICQLSINEQEETLSELFNNWKGSLEQVDDVTIIGFKL